MTDMPSDTGVRASNCMVATGHPLAAKVATAVLKKGGSAIDAAIAADAVLGVVEPMATGIGGDLLAMIIPPDGEPLTYNGTGRSPRALTADLVANLPGNKIPERHPLSVTVPGVVRGWFDLHQRYGRLPWAELFPPAIDTARNGFAVAGICAREWKLFEPVLQGDPVSAKLYRAGNVPAAGDIFTNPELADVLAAIAHDGPDSFYLGKPAKAAEEGGAARGAVIAQADFADHTGFFDFPVRGDFRGLTVLECPPNTHGLAVTEALRILDALDLDPNDPQTHVAMVRAVGDGLALAKKTVADPAGNTVCTAIVDSDGFAVTLMTSVFKRFGSGIGVPGCGFALQNRASGFSSPGGVNGVGPAKRAYHTVIPAAALKDGAFHAVFGVVGGAMQPQGQVQILTRLAAWNQPLQAAIDAPRWRLESETGLAIEAGTDSAIEDALRGAGYVNPAGSGELGGRSDFGGAQFVMRDSDGTLVGGSDKRKDGMALGA